MSDKGQSAALSVGEAARRLNLGPIDVRRLILSGALAAYRNNRGHWRVRVETLEGIDRSRLPDPDTLNPALSEQAILEEIGEIDDRASDRDATITELRDIADRQAALLERALEGWDSAETRARNLEQDMARALGLLERSVARAEAADAAVERLEGLLDRALAQLETARLQRVDKEPQSGPPAGFLIKALSLLNRRNGS